VANEASKPTKNDNTNRVQKKKAIPLSQSTSAKSRVMGALLSI